MGEPLLLLRLEGPLQSWGTRSRWDVRDTGLEPTKSGVVGLVGCAVGLRRDNPELESLDRALLFGVRLDRPGVISTDYQTVTGYHRTAAGEFKHSDGTAKTLAKAREHAENTIVSPRDYLHDAAFLVALALRPEARKTEADLLNRLKGHLQNPRWPLYLGRKSCVPSRPVFERFADEYDDLVKAFQGEPWAGPLPRDKSVREAATTTKLQAWVEYADGEFERQDAMRLNQIRFYDFRRCKRIEIDTGRLAKRIQ